VRIFSNQSIKIALYMSFVVNEMPQ